MTSLDEVINTSPDVREVKRALSVKMLQSGITPVQIHSLLNVSVQYVSKWKTQYEANGVSSLLIAYKGKESYINANQEDEIIQWIQDHKTLSIEQVIEHITQNYGVTYKLGCLKMVSRARFSCPEFGPRSRPAPQYLGQLIGFSAYLWSSRGDQ